MLFKKISLPVLLIIVLLSISGCKIGQNYQRPDFKTGNSYRFSEQNESVSFADTSWMYLFTDTVLQGMIRRGLQNNFDLKIAYERVNQARASFRQARADLYPSLGVSGTYAFNHQQTAAKDRIKYHDLYATANLTWELDIWGKLRRAKESEKAGMMTQEAYRQGIRISLIAGIATAYFNLLEYEDELQITQYNVELRKKSLELVSYKLIAGTVSGLVVAQAEAELAQVKTQVPVLEKLVANQENALRLILGELPGSISTGDSIINQMNDNIIPRAGIPSQLLIRRPDIIAAEQQLVAANAQVGVARGKMLPTLGITADFGYSQLGAGLIGSAIGNLVAPIFNMGKLRANLSRSQSIKEEMLLTYQKAIYNGLSEVSNGIFSVEKQKAVIEESIKLTTAAQTAFNLSDQLFNAGYASFLDVLDAQRTLYQAQVNQTQEYNNQLQSIVNLYLALGGGWK